VACEGGDEAPPSTCIARIAPCRGARARRGACGAALTGSARTGLYAPGVDREDPLLNLFVVLGVFVLFMGVLLLLDRWQRRIADLERSRVVSEIREAEHRGTHKPLAQHPQIDVETCIGCGSCIAACPEEDVLGLVDGVARVIHGARCVGHGLCETACPVAAVKVGLGDLSLRPDLPVLSDGLETTVPGIHIAGELGGFALIRNAVSQGVRAIEAIAASLAATRERRDGGVPDVLIVGAGPAGLAAMLAAMERGLTYEAISEEDAGGTVRKYPRRKLTLTGQLVLPLHGPVRGTEFLKEELIQFFENDVIRRFGLRIRTGVKLLGVERDRGGLVARTSAGSIPSRRVILALGRRGTPRKLGVPGEESEKVLYSLVDAATYERSRLLVVGGGDSAVEAATALASQRGNEVTVSYRRGDFFRLKKRNEDRIREFARAGKVRILFESEVSSIEPDAVRIRVREGGIERALTLRNDAVFIFAGGEPPHELLRKIGMRFHGDAAAPAPPPRPLPVRAGNAR
jgi:thioredoxin reductase (NADPH)